MIGPIMLLDYRCILKAPNSMHQWHFFSKTTVTIFDWFLAPEAWRRVICIWSLSFIATRRCRMIWGQWQNGFPVILIDPNHGTPSYGINKTMVGKSISLKLMLFHWANKNFRLPLNGWLSPRLQYLQCVTKADIAVLHYSVEIRSHSIMVTGAV